MAVCMLCTSSYMSIVGDGSELAVVITFLENKMDSQGLIGMLASLDRIICRHNFMKVVAGPGMVTLILLLPYPKKILLRINSLGM